MKTVLFVGLLVLGTLTVMAQVTPVDTTNGRPYYILLKDGSHIFGRIIRRDSTMYTVKMRGGQLTYLERELFKSISGTDPAVGDSTVYYKQPATTRPAQANVLSDKYVVVLTDGTKLTGQVVSQDSARLVLKTTNIGTVYIPANRVLRMERERLRGGASYGSGHPTAGYPNLFPQYLNFTPTAYQAEPGKVYYRNSMLFVNQFDVGVTRNLSLGAGFVFLPDARPGLFQAGWLTAKLSVPVGETVRLGVQGQLVTTKQRQYIYSGYPYTYRDRYVTDPFVQGLLSIGTSQRNITIGVGKVLSDSEDDALVTVAIVRKLSPLVSLISENQIVGLGRGAIIKLGGGVRFDRYRHSFDVSIHTPLYASTRSWEAGNLLPWGSYQIRIGK